MSSQWNGLTPEKKAMFERGTLNETSGSVLLQTYINRTVQELTVRELGLLAVMPRKQGQGDMEYINVRTALEDTATAATSGGMWVTDSETLTAATGTYAQKSFPYKTLATRGTVTRFLQARGRNYGDLLAESLRSKAEDFANTLENGLINGDTAVSGYAAACNGLLTMLNNAGSAALGVNRFFCMEDISTPATPVATNLPQALTLAKLDEGIDAVKGAASKSNMVILCSKAGHRKLNALLQADQQFNNVVEIDAGFRVRTYDGIPIIQCTNIGDEYSFDVSDTLTAWSGGSSTAFIIMNLDYCYLSELTPTTVMPLSKASSQYDSYDIFWDGAPVVSNVYGAAVVAQVSV
jgi:hypothetical protein